jgi:hypothetical protein
MRENYRFDRPDAGELPISGLEATDFNGIRTSPVEVFWTLVKGFRA